MRQIKKIISIGSNCIATDWAHFLGIREKSPVDNFAEFQIWKSSSLFTERFEKLIFKYPHSKRPSTEKEIKDYKYRSYVYLFNEGFQIVHGDFDSRRFQRELKRRIKSFKKYVKRSEKDDDLWFVYSLNYNDENLTESQLYRIKNSLPKSCSDKLICLGIRGKNKNFENVFKYYLELDGEENYKWGNKQFAKELANEIEKKYQIKVLYEKK